MLSKLPGHEKLDRDGADVHTYFEAEIPNNGAVFECSMSRRPIRPNSIKPR